MSRVVPVCVILTVCLGLWWPQACAQEAIAPPEVPRHVHVLPSSNPQIAKIQAALKQLTAIEFPGNPLSDAIQYIGTLHNIPVSIDLKALHEQGGSSNTPVKLFVQDVSLQAALGQMLRDVEGGPLDFVIRDETLVITSAAAANKTFETRLYDVRALQVQDPRELVRVVEAGTSGEWDASQSVHGAAAFMNGVLVVRQTARVHTEVEELLNTLNDHFQKSR